MVTDLQVLLVEDDSDVRLGCEQAMQLANIRVFGVISAEEAKLRLKPFFHGIVVTDVRLPEADGMSLLRWIREMDPDLPVIVITGHGDVTLAVEAMRSGAYDFIPKPFAPEVLIEVVMRALEKRALTLEIETLRRRLEHRDGIEDKIIGQSPQIERVRRTILEVAGNAVDVLVRGETGSGKELVARCLHEHSPRRNENYVALNCGGMPDTLLDSELFGHEPGAFTGAQKRRIGRIEFANQGTLFLDEVESMPMSMQIKLLRVLQERQLERLGSNQTIPISCQVVAATKEDLKLLSQDNKFRPDLYYRLNVVNIDIPPLRDRREDIPMLFEHFVLQAARRYARPLPPIDSALTRELMTQSWPGNVRELRNVADCHVLGVRKEDAPLSAPAITSLSESVERFERTLIASELERQGGSLARASRAMNIAKTTLHDKIRKYGLSSN